MKRIGFAAVFALVGLAGAARAATLSVAPDETSYLVGETITLTVTGDSQGGTDGVIRGQLQYSSALTSPGSTPTQTTHTTGGLPWVPVALSQIDGQSDVFNQARGLPATVDQPQIAIAKLVADAIGTVDVTWTTTGGAALDFFGLTSASGTSFTITPEPGTATLLVLGLAGIVFVGRRRQRN